MDDKPSDVRTTLSNATRVERQTKAASRWFPRYLLALAALAFSLIVAVEVFFPTGNARLGAAAGWALAFVLLGWWAESHDVHPEKAGRRVLVAGAVWFGSYLLVGGPLVRWQAGTSLTWWSVAAAAMATPFLIGAWLARRQS